MKLTKRERLLLRYLEEVVKEPDFPGRAESVQIPICGYVVEDLFSMIKKNKSEDKLAEIIGREK